MPEEAGPLAREHIVARGVATHPCVTLTPEDVKETKHRVGEYPWARALQVKIIESAEPWLRESDSYWLEFLPEPGACYAYGFTGDPVTGTTFGTWSGARCDWDHPGQVRNTEGRRFPNEEYPDDGEGYVAKDGRVHYFVGIFNAWVTEQWTLNALPALSQAYLLIGDERYADRGTLLLDALASIYSESTSGSWDYPSNPPSGRFARPWYQVARTLVKYVDQYDFMYHSPSMDKPSRRAGFTRRENIEQHLLLDGAYYCYQHSFDGALHNGHADYLRGALAVGCAMDIPEYVAAAVESPFSISTMLGNNIDRDGRYYESALGYAVHARLLYLTFADPLYNLRSAEYPNGINLYDDPRMQTSLLLPDLQVELAGRRPNFGDSAPEPSYRKPPEHPFSKTDYLFLERLYAMTSNSEQRATFGSALQYLAQGNLETVRAEHADEWMLWHAASVPDLPEALSQVLNERLHGSWVAGAKGLALLRGGDQAALLRFGPSLNHGDPDDLGLLYYANGYELSYDIGYGLGSTHTHVGWASSTVSHCLVTVDETNQLAGEGSGGSLNYFAALPGVQVVDASSPLSYSAQGVSDYRRTVALVNAGGYLVDVFRVTGGRQHDYGFGSIGTELTVEGVAKLEPHEGSLAEGYDWGQQIGNDGDIKGHPNKPYWNPPPGNGYGFFYNVRRGKPDSVWSGTWNIAGEAPARLRMHILSDPGEAIVASAPGLYPNKPPASYLLSRRVAGDDKPLSSTFVSVYESFAAGEEDAPVIRSVRRIGTEAIEVERADGAVDVVLCGGGTFETAYGSIIFDGDFAYLTGDGTRATSVDVLGCIDLKVNGNVLDSGPDAFEATVVAADRDTCSVELNTPIPEGLEQLVAVFSNPLYSRTTAYHVEAAQDSTLVLQGSSFVVGKGRVAEIRDEHTIVSDVTHEYAKTVRAQLSTRYFDGKTIVGEDGGTTRVRGTEPGTPLVVTVDDASVLQPGEVFVYRDVVEGDTVRIALPRTHTITD
ncbi:MAG: hypothetical protein AMXMBFR82_08080 [Candidatus Hydrogenedentota bacterium]